MSLDPNGRLGLSDVVRLLRDDIRQAREDIGEDLQQSEARVTKEIDEARGSFLAYQSEHLGVHNRRAEDTDKIHRELTARLDAQEIVEAQRAGRTAVLLLIIRTVGQHWQALAAVVALIGLLLGRVELNVAPP